MDHLDVVHQISDLLREVNAKNTKLTGKNKFPPEFPVSSIPILLTLHAQGPLKVSDIAGKLHMADSNVSTMCSRLEKMGYVERFRLKEDQRVVRVQLTDATRAKTGNIVASVEECHRMIQKHTTPEEITTILCGLDLLNQLFDRVLEEMPE